MNLVLAVVYTKSIALTQGLVEVGIGGIRKDKINKMDGTKLSIRIHDNGE